MGDLKVNRPGTGPLKLERPPTAIPQPANPQPAKPLAPMPIESVPVPVDQLKVVPTGTSLQSLDWLDKNSLDRAPLATLSAHFRVQDIDGLDQKSSGDLRGQFDADVTLNRSLFDRSVALANAQNPDFKIGISYENGQYRIPIAYKTRLMDIGVGSIYLKPEGGKLKVEIGGLAGGVASAANFISFGNVKPIIDNLIHSLTRDMGFKVSSSSVTDYVLEPDLQNSPLFREFPLAGGEKLKLESVQSGQNSLISLTPDAAGNLRMQVKNLDVVASSGPGSAQARPDAEGADQMSLDAKGQLNRDFSSDVATDLSLSLDVTAAEKAGLQARIQSLTGQNLPVSGKVEIDHLRVQTHLQPDASVGRIQSQGGQLSAEQLEMQLGPTAARLDQVSGGLNLTRQGTVTRLETSDVSLKGGFTSPQGALQIQQMSLSGVLQHDEKRPTDLRFALSPGSTLAFSGQLSQGNQSVGIQKLTLSNAELEAKLGDGQLQLLGTNGQTPEAKVQKLTLPGTDLRALDLKGTLSASLTTGALDVDAKSFSLGGIVGDIRLDHLSGSGRMHFDATHGLQLDHASFNARGNAGDFAFTKLSGNGSLQVSPSGQLQLNAVTGLDLQTNIGLGLKGNFSGAVDGANLNVQTLGNSTARMDYTPKGSAQPLSLRGLGLKGAQLDANLAQGRVLLQSRPGATLSATAQSIKLPDLELKGLTMKGGQLETDLSGSHVSLRSQPQHTLDASAESITLPAMSLKNVHLKGGLEADARSGQIDIDASSFSLQADLGDLQLTKLRGSGKAHIDPSGTVRLDETHQLELETNIGVKLKGDFKGQIHYSTITADTLGTTPASLDYHAPDGSLAIEGVQLQGHLDTDFEHNTFRFESTGPGNLKMAKGVFSGLEVKNVDVAEGTLTYKPGEFAIAPSGDGPVRASGEISGIKLSNLETSGPVRYNFDKQEVSWDQPATLALPDQGVQQLKTSGPVSLQVMPSGELVFSSHGSTFDATIGDLHLEHLQTEGQVIFNPANGSLRFAGFDGKPLHVEGSFNGKPLKLASSGQIQIQDTGTAFKISGEQIKLAGLVDGYTLDSPDGAQGTVTVKHDFSGFELNDLNIGFTLDDVAVDKGGGSIRTTPEGLEISLKGSLGADRGKLQALMTKLSNQADFGTNFQQAMAQVNTSLNQSIADFQDAQLNFENLSLNINRDGSLQSFHVDNNSQMRNARLEADIYGKKKVLPMGDVTWTAQVEGDGKSLRIPQGHIAFGLTEDLRKSLAEEIKHQLEDSGLKKVKLEIEPDGKVKILNATIDGKLIDVSAKLELSTRIVNNQLEVSLDKMHLRNFLLDIVAQIANAPDKVADQVDGMLAQQHLKYQRRNASGQPDPQSGRVFALDLQALINQVNPGIHLKSASLDPQGQVQMDYSYETRLP